MVLTGVQMWTSLGWAGSKNNLGPKEFESQEKMWVLEKNLGLEKHLDPKKNLGPKNICVPPIVQDMYNCVEV